MTEKEIRKAESRVWKTIAKAYKLHPDDPNRPALIEQGERELAELARMRDQLSR